jgi:DNA-binding response OmpR family regulator
MSRGKHILIVEDEIFLAMMLQDLLEDDGYDVSKVASVSDALDAIGSRLPSAAILDVNLAGEQAYPVARALRELGIPFMFATGYGERRLPEEFAGEQTLQKPYLPHRIKSQLGELLEG